jgi:D-alanyl-D-alanine carboxypeptidase/D-alanyl-D-alanine-endopeptidase (penicillin-binding protein 4)
MGRAWLAALVMAAISWAGSAALAGPLDDRVWRAISATDLGKASVGVAVVDVQTGEVLASHNARTALIPASNMKLLSSGAALETLGAEHAFRTTILLAGTPEDATVILQGSGDPALGDPKLLSQTSPPLDIEELLRRMASAVSKRGVRNVREVVVDDRVFDRQRVHPTWPTDQLNEWYCAEVSGLNFHTNVLEVYASPASSGGPPGLVLVPRSPWVEIENRGRSVSKGRSTAWLSRPRAENSFTLYGDVKDRTQIDVTLADPALFAGRQLARVLADAGITFGGASRAKAEHVRIARDDEDFSQATAVAAVTTGIGDVLRRCNADSQNLFAEALLKATGNAVTGEPGSWENGGAVVRMMLSEKLGPEHAAATTIADGSGMSRANRVSAATLADWLKMLARDDRVAQAFKDSLARPGEGTLRSRFRDPAPRNSVLAKSGYLRGVYSLSGYVVHDATGRTIAFSIILNDVPQDGRAGNAKPLHEKIVAEIDRYLTQTAGAPAVGG